MTIEQTVEIQPNHRLVLDLPFELPVGKARLEMTVTPEIKPMYTAPKPLKSLFGIHKGLDSMDAYFARKRADKLREDTQIRRNGS